METITDERALEKLLTIWFPSSIKSGIFNTTTGGGRESIDGRVQYRVKRTALNQRLHLVEALS